MGTRKGDRKQLNHPRSKLPDKAATSDEPILTVGGIRVDRKESPTAMIALIISLGTLIANGVIWLHANRAEVVRFDDGRILAIISPGRSAQGFAAVHFIVQMSYFNRGSIGYNDILTAESVGMQIGSRYYPYSWAKFTSYEFDNSAKTAVLKITSAGQEALPRVVPAQLIEQHLSYFEPQVKREDGFSDYYANAVTRDELIKAIETSQPIGFRITWTTELGHRREENFDVVYDPGQAERLAAESTSGAWMVLDTERSSGLGRLK